MSKQQPRMCAPVARCHALPWFWVVASSLVGCIAYTSLTTAAEAPTPAATTPTSFDGWNWPTDLLDLKNGQRLRGWVKAEHADGVQFTALVREPGKPLYTTTQTVPREKIANLTKISPAERQQLQQVVEQHRKRQQYERLEKHKLSLQSGTDLGPPTWRYEGAAFAFWSTANEDTVRTAIVRIEQRFAAFRQVLPPRIRDPRPLKIILWGTPEEYRAYLAKQNLPSGHAALFDVTNNTIVASSDLDRLTAEMRRIAAEHREQRTALEAERQTLRKIQREEFEELKAKGASRLEIEKYQQLRTKHFRDKQSEIERKVDEYERRNQALLDATADRTFRTLYHEAFHAYLENHVFPQDSSNVPRWLNEGLAQVLEGAPVEGGSLRLNGAEERTAFATRLLAELQGSQPLTIAEILTAPAAAFMHTTGDTPADTQRFYLYAWGLADYLTFKRNLLGSPELEEYLTRPANPRDRVALLKHFEQLLQLTLPEIEADWRKHLEQVAGTHRGGGNVGRLTD